MNLNYLLIKLNKRIRSNSPKFLYLWMAHILRLRHLYLQFDPVYVCNLACLMCNFSDPQVRKEFARLNDEEIDRIVELFFPYCSNLQIGCDAEPAAYKNYVGLVEKARRSGVRYISFTSNGQLLDRKGLIGLDQAGLSELILSAHGLTGEVYEQFMVKASFEKFIALLETIHEIKPRYLLRLNYTVNDQNFRDLRLLPEYVRKYGFNVVQIRQMVDVGQTGYTSFNLERHAEEYQAIIDDLHEELKGEKVEIFAERVLVTTVAPGKSNVFIPAILRRISPKRVWKKDFDWRNETYWDYCRRTNYTRYLWWGILGQTDRLIKSIFSGSAENAGRYY